jgi:biopolymer transport protein ExbD
MKAATCTIRTATMLALSTAALLAAVAAVTPSRAQQPAMTVVTLLSGTKGIVGAKAVATKDIAARVAAQQVGRPGLNMVTVRSCAKVSPDTVQGVMKELQRKKLVVVLDLDAPDARLCAG